MKELEQAYQLVVENESKGTVDATELPKPGVGFDNDKGMKSQQKGVGYDSPAAKDVDSPEEMEDDLNPGHGTIAEEKEIKDMMPTSKFDDLYQSTLVNEEFGDDESPLEQTGEGEFNDEAGDFPGEGGEEDITGEEVDVATELRLIIDRLNDLAEKLGAYDDEEGEMEGGEEDMEYEEGGMDYEGVGEAYTGGPGKGSDGKLSKYPDRTKKMQSKGSQKVSGSSDQQRQTAKGQGNAGGPGCQAADGKIKKFKDSKTKMQGKGNMVVSGKAGVQGKSIFDSK